MWVVQNPHMDTCHIIVVLLASSPPHFVLMVLNEFHVQIFISLSLNSKNHKFWCSSLKEFMVRPLSNPSSTHSLRCLEMCGAWKDLCEIESISNAPTNRSKPKCNHLFVITCNLQLLTTKFGSICNFKIKFQLFWSFLQVCYNY